jgi:hypothetical protein
MLGALKIKNGLFGPYGLAILALDAPLDGIGPENLLGGSFAPNRGGHALKTRALAQTQ